MVISIKNASIINKKDVYLHDDLFLYLHFARKEKVLGMQFKTKVSEEEYLIRFIDVIGFQSSSCEYWGGESYVLDFEYIEPKQQTLLPLIIDKWNKDSATLFGPFPEDIYIETLFTFSSGDCFRICCKEIEIPTKS